MQVSKHVRLYVLCVGMLFGSISPTQLTLSIDGARTTIDEQTGVRIPKVFLGEPFQIKLSVADPPQTTAKITIHGLDALQVVGRSSTQEIRLIGSSMSSVKTFIYDVIVSDEGRQTIGPASVEVDGSILESNTVAFDTTQRKSSPHTAAKDGMSEQNAEEYFALLTNKEQVVLGEPVVLTSKFYFQGGMGDSLVTLPELPGFLVQEVNKEASASTEIIEGEEWLVHSKDYVLLPLNEGEKKIAPARITYLKPFLRQGGSAFNDPFFSNFFGRGSRQKMLASNDLSIEVKPLPAHKGRVDGVGTFNRFAFQLSSQKATLHQPLTLTVEIEGEGNLAQIESPTLHLPKSFTHYESKVEEIPLPSEGPAGGKKQFTYIVQVNQPGTWEIPSHHFTYFDVDKRAYKTLASEPLKLAVNGDPTGIVSPPAVQKAGTGLDNEPVHDEPIAFIEEEGPIVATSRVVLPLWLLLLMLMIPPGVVFSRRLGIVWGASQAKFSHMLGINTLLRGTQKACRALAARGDVAGLYALFMQYFAARYGVLPHVVHEAFIEDMLRKACAPSDMIGEFLAFLSVCAHASFSAKTLKETEKTQLFLDASAWLTKIDNIVRTHADTKLMEGKK